MRAALSIQDEQELWRKINQQDRQALTSLYLAYHDTLLDYARKLAHDEALALNCLQELFVQLWHQRGRLSDVKSVKIYLIVALRRRVVRQLKQEQARSRRQFSFQEVQPALEFSAEELVMLHETEAEVREQMADSLNRLPERQREIIYLRYYENLSIQEIADLLHMQYQSVSNNLQRAYKTLRTNPLLRKLAQTFLLLMLGFLK
ncbi:RNA polymerase sigma factor, sigma-70 family [Catalinimonas alkaloidigena]|uniref:RNA polymerase sigma factor, sigma-70 family n=1 Tax=Catalinimonas alkaloidigena TaxID=1075417 RepID=A0A1G9IU10_9BACT|nr:sigma-70 family RNA polymerase sigma factor [Catalinimonas alkaloidigena]SDL28687.1 RNA polymerase sigma factor, sigma-70 family [Catalinimonas alkaloidigena]